MSEELGLIRELSDSISQSATPYGDLTAVDRDNRISISSDVGLSEQRDDYTAGVSRLDNDSVIRLRANASTETLQTVDQLTYSPGYIGEIGVAIQIPQRPTGDQVVRWGYSNANDGIRWGWDSTSLFIEDKRNGTEGGKIRPADWNDIPDDSSPDEIASRLEEVLLSGGITRQKLALYNYGTVEHEIYERDGNGELQPISVHNFNPDSGTILSRQNNPIRVEVDNPASEDFDVFVADRQASIRGQFTPNDRVHSEAQTSFSLSGETWVPLITFRIKPEFDTISVRLVQYAAIATDPVLVQFRSDAGSTDPADYATPTDTDPNETAAEVDTSPTASISDGFKRFQQLIPGGGSGNSVAPLGQIEGVDLSVKQDRPLTVFVRKANGSGGTINASNLSWSETW